MIMPKTLDREINIKAVIFDNHGVLTRSNGEGGYKKIATFLGVSDESVKTAIAKQNICFDLGEITTDEFLERVLEDTEAKRTLDEFKKFYISCYEPKEDVRKLARELSKHFKVALLANAGHAFDECHKNCGFEKIFGENIFVSAKLRMMKPDKKIFEHVLNKLQVQSEEAVLIDDKSEFIDAALRLGMSAIQFKSREQVEKDLESMLEYQYV